MSAPRINESESKRYYLGRLGKALKLRNGKESPAKCPFHRDRTASMSVNFHKGVWFCHAGCGSGGILDFEHKLTGKPLAECWDTINSIIGRPAQNGDQPEQPQASSTPRRIVATSDFHDPDGKVLFQEVRYVPKEFRLRRPDGKGGWLWNMNGVTCGPYNLPVLETANVALVTEGTKDADNAQKAATSFPNDGNLIYAATTNAMGALHWTDEHSKHLNGKSAVYVFEDNDKTGRKRTQLICPSIAKYAQAVYVVEFPELPEHGDVSDFLRDHTPAELYERMQAAPKWTTPADGTDVREPEPPWPKPEDLGSELPPVPEFDPELLPNALRPWCIDIAELMQVPLDFPAVAAVAALGAAVMRRAKIQPKALDSSWTEYPNLWGAIVASPGLMKSPVIDAATATLRGVESIWRVEYESEVANTEASEEIAALKKRAWEQQYIATLKKGGAVSVQLDDSIPKPRQKRLLTSDATFESLHEIMRDNPAGIACWRDELTGWLAGLERQGRESERAFFLESWSGHAGFIVDRIGRGSIHVEHCCTSVFGGIQPGRLRSYLADVLSGGPTDDGLIQRFSLLVWPDFNGDWHYVDRFLNTEARRTAADLYERLVKLDAENPLLLKFAPAAQKLFIEWLTELEGKVRSDDTPLVMRGHLAKYRKLMPALSLLFALADGHNDAVPSACAQRAAAWCEYLEAHAIRVYASKIAPEMAAAQTLGRKLKNGWHAKEGRFTVRDVYRPQWTGLTSPDEARAALLVLAEYNWVRRVPHVLDKEGRPSDVYQINPKIREIK